MTTQGNAFVFAGALDFNGSPLGIVRVDSFFAGSGQSQPVAVSSDDLANAPYEMPIRREVSARCCRFKFSDDPEQLWYKTLNRCGVHRFAG